MLLVRNAIRRVAKKFHLKTIDRSFIINVEGNGDIGRPHYPRRKLMQNDLQVTRAIPYLR